MRPDKCVRARSLMRRWGLTPAAAYGLAAIRYPDSAAVIDERGTLTFADVQSRTDAVARGFRAAGIDHRATVAVMCRNHRWFIEATVACSKLGANIVYIDPAITRTALARLMARENPYAIVFDGEFSELIEPVARARQCFLAWCDAGQYVGHPRLDDLARAGAAAPLSPPGAQRNSTIVLAPEGRGDRARKGRELPGSLLTPGAVLSRIPLRARGTTMVAAPMCRGWGFLHFTLGMRLASTLVLTRAFDPQETLEVVEEHRIGALAVLPEMLRSIIELPEVTSRCNDTKSLSVIAVQGPALASELAIPAMTRFGNVLYSLHGTTVVQLGGDWVRQTFLGGGSSRQFGQPTMFERAGFDCAAARMPHG